MQVCVRELQPAVIQRQSQRDAADRLAADLVWRAAVSPCVDDPPWRVMNPEPPPISE
jgi:hypothetical protein